MSQRNLRAVLIVGPDIEIKNQDIKQQIARGTLKQIGDGKKPISKNDLLDIQDKVGPNTKIYICGHGSVTSKEHTIDLMRGLDKTTDAMQSISQALPQARDFHLSSCFGGAALKNPGNITLGAGKAITVHAEDELPVLQAEAELEIHKSYEAHNKSRIQRKDLNILQDFVNNLHIKYQTATILYKHTNDKIFEYSFRPPVREILGEQDTQRFLKDKAKDFKEAIERFDPQLAANIEIPTFNERQCATFASQSFHSRFRNNPKGFNQFLEEIADGIEPQWKQEKIRSFYEEHSFQETLGHLNYKTSHTLLKIIDYKKYPNLAKFVFQEAWRRKDYKTMLEAIENGIDPNVEIGKTTLREYALTKPELLKSMIRAGVDYAQERQNPQTASKNKDIQEILKKYQPRKRQDIEAQNPSQQVAQAPQPEQRRNFFSKIFGRGRQTTTQSQAPSPEEIARQQREAQRQKLKEQIEENISLLEEINAKCAFVQEETMKELKTSFEKKGVASQEFGKAFGQVEKEFQANQSKVQNVMASLKYRFKQALNYIGLRVEKANEMGEKARQATSRNSGLNQAKAGGFVEKLMKERAKMQKLDTARRT